ncbi:glycoside hydrolase family 5 protein [Nocardioides sambongensis]|uniref:glycoside hydrolase family 5 protein n=1 Tax=Nocardioides sambongensis TaxID=2589074 RepID=UPI0015E87369|nr:cellulase family glycosylhydrolase [Nocardioides sambongensis]
MSTTPTRKPGRTRRLAGAIAALAAAVAVLSPIGAAQARERPEPPRATHATATFPTRTVTDRAGNTLLADRSGRSLDLRGTNLGKFDDITEADVARMGAAGFTLLRLPIQWRKLEPVQGEYDATYLQHIRDVLGWADEHGLLVMVDWHQDVFGPAFGFDGIPAWATRDDDLPYERWPGNWFDNYFQPAVQAAFDHLWNDEDLRQAQVNTWTYLAEHLAGEPALLGYDLFNEPMAGTIEPEDLADPSLTQVAVKALAFERGELAAMYRRVIAGIRTVDSTSWLWVEPTVLVGEGLPTQLPAFDDPRPGADRIGYAPHAYSTAVEDGDDWDTDSGFVETYERAITAYPRKNDMPVIVGEWGPIAARDGYPGNVELVKQQAASFSRFASGWTIWYGCISENGGGYCIFSDEEGNLDPGRSAAWRPYPLALAGTRVSEHLGAAGYRLRVDPRRSPRVSSVVVPGGFADRVAVRITNRGRTAKNFRIWVSGPSSTGTRTVTWQTGPKRRSTYVVTISRR